MIQRRQYIKRGPAPKRKAGVRKRRKGSVAAMRRKLNLQWSAIIRASNGGRCWMEGKDTLRCGGPIQAAHCFGKKAHPSTRFELWCGLPLCRDHHCRYTHKVEAWNFLLLQAWGLEIFTERFRDASTPRKHDYAAIAAELEAAAKEVA